MSFLFDAVIVLLLAFFAWRGSVRGLVLSLCSLAVVFAAFFAARSASDAFCVPVSNIVRPVITRSVRDAVREVESLGAEAEQYGYTLDGLLGCLEENERFRGFSGFVRRAAPADIPVRDSPVGTLAGWLSKGIAKIAVFGGVFLVVQLVWFLLSHTLELKVRLPIPAGINLAGGLVIGLTKGVLLTVVLVWLGQASGVIPNPPETPVLSLFTVEKLSELLATLPA